MEEYKHIELILDKEAYRILKQGLQVRIMAGTHDMYSSGFGKIIEAIEAQQNSVTLEKRKKGG